MSSQAYTPGLKIKRSCIVEKTRRLPIKGEVLVKQGDEVSCDDIVARTTIPGTPQIVDVALALGIDVAEVESYMVKKIGEFVNEKEPLAILEAFMGLVKRSCLSPVAGTLEHVSNITGQAIVRESPEEVRIQAYIPGIVTEVLPSEGIVVRTSATYVQGIFGIGGETNGELMAISKNASDVVDADQITADCKGKVLICGAVITLNALRKSVELGTKGIVVGGIVDKDLIDFVGYDIGVAITGHEEVGLSLIITEGFGKMAMREKTFELLQGLEGRLACINGATQIRAGVMRPEIIIPDQSSSRGSLVEARSEEETRGVGLEPGTVIRSIRKPYFGALGKVISLPVELRRLESGSLVRILEAELADGKRVTIPRANVEIIEE